METQKEFTTRSRGVSQCDRILEALQERAGQPVPMPELSAAGANSPGGFCMVHSRVADLRKRSHTITHTQQWINGECHSFYCLTPQPALTSHHD